MVVITWPQGIALQHADVDRVHMEFIEQLDTMADSLNAGLDVRGALDALIAHTEAHFAMEEGDMAKLGYAPGNCHARQHEMVLELLREVQRQVSNLPNPSLVERLLLALAEWFPQHVANMDAPLVDGLLAQPAASAAPASSAR